MWKTQVKIGQSRHPNTSKLCRCSCSFLMKRKLMGRRVNATLLNLWQWDKIIQGPRRNQKYGLQKTEATLKSRTTWVHSLFGLRGHWAGTGSETVNGSPRLATLGPSLTPESRGHIHRPVKISPTILFSSSWGQHCLKSISQVLPLYSKQIFFVGINWADPLGVECFSFCPQGFSLQLLYYSNVQILLLFQFN